MELLTQSEFFRNSNFSLNQEGIVGELTPVHFLYITVIQYFSSTLCLHSQINHLKIYSQGHLRGSVA